MRAAIDIGSNSIRSLLLDDHNCLVSQRVEETRLGEGFDSGRLTESSMQRTLSALSSIGNELHLQGAKTIITFATSAVRDAKNGADFCARARELGLPVRVLSGEEEARYGFLGAVGGFAFPLANCLLIDVGGGSTELAWYDRHAGMVRGISVPMGAVRYRVTAPSHAQVKALFQERLAGLQVIQSYIIGVGGTITTAAAIFGAVTEYTRERIHGIRLGCKDLEAIACRLAPLSIRERCQVPGLPPPRADIILYGLDILLLLLAQIGRRQILVSDYGILDGILEAEK